MRERFFHKIFRAENAFHRGEGQMQEKNTLQYGLFVI